MRFFPMTMTMTGLLAVPLLAGCSTRFLIRSFEESREPSRVEAVRLDRRSGVFLKVRYGRTTSRVVHAPLRDGSRAQFWEGTPPDFGTRGPEDAVDASPVTDDRYVRVDYQDGLAGGEPRRSASIHLPAPAPIDWLDPVTYGILASFPLAAAFDAATFPIQVVFAAASDAR